MLKLPFLSTTFDRFDCGALISRLLVEASAGTTARWLDTFVVVLAADMQFEASTSAAQQRERVTACPCFPFLGIFRMFAFLQSRVWRKWPFRFRMVLQYRYMRQSISFQNDNNILRWTGTLSFVAFSSRLNNGCSSSLRSSNSSASSNENP